MAIKDLSINDLIELAKSPNHEEAVDQLMERIILFDRIVKSKNDSESAAADEEKKKQDEEIVASLKEAAPKFEELLVVWADEIIQSSAKAELCIALAAASLLDTPAFRDALACAVKKLLPPYLAGSSVTKAIGAKDENVSVRDVAVRLRKLQHLRSTAIVYQQETHQCGKINGIDKVTSTIAVAPFRGMSVSSVPISEAVINCFFFDMTPEVMNLLYPSKSNCRSSSEYRRILNRNTLSEISESKIKDLVFHLMVPELFSQDEFADWWDKKPATTETVKKREFFESRSILELYSLLKDSIDKETGVVVSDEAAAKLQDLFSKIRPNTNPKDMLMLAQSVSCLSMNGKTDALVAAFKPLLGKASFWPTEITREIPLANLEIWGKIAAKYLNGFINAGTMLYSNEDLVKLATQLPLRCISAIFERLPPELVNQEIRDAKYLSCDMVLWIWKNKSALPPYIKDGLTMERVVTALLSHDLPKEWTAAQRELKRNLFEKADFQKFIIGNADGDMTSIIDSLQKYRDIIPSERQTLLVKLSNQSKELLEYIESGAGRKMMGAAVSKPEQAPVTSVRSLRKLNEELEDLINKQIPDNAAAVALARSFGDLRENAEYDAAKERRRYLHKRRSDLEKILGFIQSTDFKNVEIKDHVVMGCEVSLKSSDGKIVRYLILGAWDGDPEKNWISYKTKIGEVLLDKKVGTTVKIPEAGSFVIEGIAPIPEDIRKQLADEA